MRTLKLGPERICGSGPWGVSLYHPPIPPSSPPSHHLPPSPPSATFRTTMSSIMDFPSRTELLIRSASSLLSIISEPTFPPYPQNPLIVRLVDRTALLFVTEPEADASAVAVILTGKETIMMRVTEGSTQTNGGEISRTTGHDWLSGCCR